MSKIINFLKDVRIELAKVSWPTRKQTVQYTGVVILMSVLVAAFLGAWDGLFSFILNKLLIK
ncbi:MAG: preprotein translocase subunit SecE [Minisyncoccia bacterium]|jgi:preprotein translocase subunit SecE